jgi:hypothetical protein
VKGQGGFGNIDSDIDRILWNVMGSVHWSWFGLSLECELGTARGGFWLRQLFELRPANARGSSCRTDSIKRVPGAQRSHRRLVRGGGNRRGQASQTQACLEKPNRTSVFDIQGAADFIHVFWGHNTGTNHLAAFAPPANLKKVLGTAPFSLLTMEAQVRILVHANHPRPGGRRVPDMLKSLNNSLFSMHLGLLLFNQLTFLPGAILERGAPTNRHTFSATNL